MPYTQTISLPTNSCSMYNLEREEKKKLQVSFVYIFACSNLRRIFKPRHIDGTSLHVSLLIFFLSYGFKILKVFSMQILHEYKQACFMLKINLVHSLVTDQSTK